MVCGFFFKNIECLNLTLQNAGVYRYIRRRLGKEVGYKSATQRSWQEDDLEGSQNVSGEKERPAGTSSSVAANAFAPPPSSSMRESLEPVPEWCKCGQCRIMPQEIENKCCKSKPYVSQSRCFRKLCLDPKYLQLSIRNSNDIRNDRDDNGSSAFRKAAYRHYILDKYGHLGKNNRKVCPSCCMCINDTPLLSIAHWYLYGIQISKFTENNLVYL